MVCNESVIFASEIRNEMKYSELIKILKDNGCYPEGHGGNHDKWFSPITGKCFFVPRHAAKEVPKGMERTIRKQAGI